MDEGGGVCATKISDKPYIRKRCISIVRRARMLFNFHATPDALRKQDHSDKAGRTFAAISAMYRTLRVVSDVNACDAPKRKYISNDLIQRYGIW